jgi:hypothetical protein
VDIGRTGDKENTNAERRKKAGLPNDSKSGKFIINNWFRLVVIGFLVIFTYQLNEIKNNNYINGSVTIDYFEKGAMDDLREIRDRD